MARQRIRAHASRWNTFTLKKKVMMAQFPSETERHCGAKKKKPASHIPSFAACTENGRGHNAQTCSLGDGPTFEVEKLVATSAKNLLDYSTYLSLDLDQTNGGIVQSFPSTRAPRLASNVSSRKKNLLRVSQRARMALHSFHERIPLTSGAYPPQASMRLDQTEKHCPETQQSHVFAAEGCGKKKNSRP